MIKYFYLFLFIISFESFSQERLSKLVPNLIESFKQIVNLSKAQSLKTLNLKDDTNTISSLDYSKYKYFIQEDYLNDIILKTPIKESLANNNLKCKFFENLWFKSLNKEKFIPIYQVAKEKKDLKFILAKKYFEDLIKKDCPAQNQTLLSLKNGRFINLDLETISNQSQCTRSFEKMKNSKYLNYIFYLGEKIQKANLLDSKKGKYSLKEKKIILDSEKIQEKIGPAKTKLIQSFTNYFPDKLNFCESFFNSDFFSKVAQNLTPYRDFLAAQCSLSGKISNSDLKTCLNDLKKNPKSCLIPNNNINKSLMPELNCKELGNNYSLSTIAFKNNDCPARIENEAIVNAGRLISKLSKSTLDTKNKFPQCIERLGINFLNFSKKHSLREAWGTKICYYNKILRKEQCYPTFFSANKENENSITNRVSLILSEMKKVQTKTKCDFISEQNRAINPSQSGRGCKIFYNSSKCLLNKCPILVYINSRKVDQFFTLKNGFNFHYYSNNYSSNHSSFHSSLKRDFKLKDSRVYNLTQVKSLLANKSLIHGIGCAEDILPTHFKRATFNKCSPLPFIVSGIKKRKNALTPFVLTNLSIDRSQTLRSLDWQTLLSSVKNYQEVHPFQHWSLYALYK